MANRFMSPYLRQDDYGQKVMNLAQLALQLSALKQRGDIAAGQQKLSEKELGMRGEQMGLHRQDIALRQSESAKRFGYIGETGEVVPGIEQEKLGLESRRVGALEQSNVLAGQKLTPREMDWNWGQLNKMQTNLRMMGFNKKNGVDAADLPFFKDILEPLSSDPNINRGQVAENLKANWDTGAKQQFVQDLKDAVIKMQQKNPNANVEKQNQIITVLENTTSDKVIPTFFPDIAQHDATQVKVEKDRPYKIGQEITRDEEGGKATYRVTGYDQERMPILEKIATGKPKEDPKGFDTMEEAVNEAKKVHTATGGSVGLLPSAEMGTGNKWIPKLVQNIEARYPTQMQAANLPPGINFDRRTGKYTDAETKRELSRRELSGLYGERAVMEADKAAYRDIDKRGELIGTFVNRIEMNTPIVMEAAKKLGNTDIKLLNVPLNRAKRHMGSGEWSALQLAITSLSNEIAKVESGSLGIAEVSVEQAKIMRLIHDPNLSINDLQKVLNMGIKLGKTSVAAINKQKEDLGRRIPQIELGEPKTPTPTEKGLKVGRFTVEVE